MISVSAIDSSQTVGASLNKLRKSGLMCDFQLVALDGTRFDCHRCVLAAACDYFKVMLCSKFREAILQECVTQLSTEELEFVLSFIYSGKATGSVLWRDNGVEPVNMLSVFITAHEWGLEELCGVLETVLAQNFQLLVAPLFHRVSPLSVRSFENLLDRDDLAVPDEKFIFRMLSAWLKYNEKSLSVFRHLAQHLRSAFLPTECLGSLESHIGRLNNLNEKCAIRRDYSEVVFLCGADIHLMSSRSQNWRMYAEQSESTSLWLMSTKSQRRILCTRNEIEISIEEHFRRRLRCCDFYEASGRMAVEHDCGEVTIEDAALCGSEVYLLVKIRRIGRLFIYDEEQCNFKEVHVRLNVNLQLDEIVAISADAHSLFIVMDLKIRFPDERVGPYVIQMDVTKRPIAFDNQLSPFLGAHRLARISVSDTYVVVLLVLDERATSYSIYAHNRRTALWQHISVVELILSEPWDILATNENLLIWRHNHTQAIVYDFTEESSARFPLPQPVTRMSRLL